jgi:hypothetical protein
MLFIDNKYTRWYFNIITRAQSRSAVTQYIEKHHIIPKSLGGDNNPTNIVLLTAKEHFICHRLLIKMTTGKAKRSMAYAAWQMTWTNGRDRYLPSARTYAELRKQLSETRIGVALSEDHRKTMRKPKSKPMSAEHRARISAQHTGKVLSDETKQKISMARKGKPRPDLVGKKYSEEHKRKISEGQIGRIHSLETRAKISLAAKNRNKSKK